MFPEFYYEIATPRQAEVLDAIKEVGTKTGAADKLGITYSGVKKHIRLLAAKDAYATWGGYRAGQDSKCLVMHKEHGEIERHTINIGMV